MKRILTLLFCVIAIAANAQQFRYGFSIAPGKNWLITEGDLYDQPNEKFSAFQYGLILDQTIGKGEYIAFTLGLNLNYSQSGLSSTNNNNAGDDKVWAIRARYIEIPLTLRLRTPQLGSLRIYGEGGISYGKCYRAVGDYTLNGLRLDSDIDYIGKDNPNGLNYLEKNAGIQMGAGTEIKVSEGASILIGFYYQKGLMNVYEDNSTDLDIFLNQAGIRIAGLF